MNGGGCVRVCMRYESKCNFHRFKALMHRNKLMGDFEKWAIRMNKSVCVFKHVAFSLLFSPYILNKSHEEYLLAANEFCSSTFYAPLLFTFDALNFHGDVTHCLFTAFVRFVCLQRSKDLINSLWIFFERLQTFSEYHSNTINY